MNRRAGFTLLEVLVALAVLAIALGAIIRAATQSITTATVLREETFAGLVAINQINQLLLDAKPWPDDGRRTGQVELAGRGWRWEARFTKTADPDLRQVAMTVRAAENGPELSRLIAFRATPPKEPPPAKPLDPAGQPPVPPQPKPVPQ